MNYHNFLTITASTSLLLKHFFPFENTNDNKKTSNYYHNCFSSGVYLVNAYTLYNDMCKLPNNQKICLYSKNNQKIAEFDHKPLPIVDLCSKLFTFIYPFFTPILETDCFAEVVYLTLYMDVGFKAISVIPSMIYGNDNSELLQIPEGNELYLAANGEDGEEITTVQSIEIFKY